MRRRPAPGPLRCTSHTMKPRSSERPACHASPRPGPGHRRDRKSTRLNPSHGYISYAVFCLKKKKTVRYVLVLATAVRRLFLLLWIINTAFVCSEHGWVDLRVVAQFFGLKRVGVVPAPVLAR